MSNVTQDPRLTGSLMLAEASACIYYSGAFEEPFNANLPYLRGVLTFAVCPSQDYQHGVKFSYLFYLTQPNRQSPLWVYRVELPFDYLFESPYFHSCRMEVRQSPEHPKI